ncbi:MAG: Ig-like domain-containing protein [Acidobacteriaceae bacterium]
MIEQFRKHSIHRQTARLGILACLSVMIGITAQAQVATRTQVAFAESGSGVWSFTAHVADVEGAAVSEGSVSFETAKGSLGSVFVHDGTATLNLTNPPAWARSVTAVYHGDTAFAASDASTAVTADATSGLPGFTVTANPSSLTLTPGQFGTVQLTVTSQNGFSEQVNLSCSGLPASAACNFNPVVVTPPANGSAISAMQVTTTAPSGSALNASLHRGGWRTAYAVVIPGLLALAGLGALRRKNFAALRMLGLAMLLVAGTLGLTACNPRYSYEHYKPSPNLGTVAGNYAMVIAAYSTNGTAITQATSSDASCAGAVCVTLTVQ